MNKTTNTSNTTKKNMGQTFAEILKQVMQEQSEKDKKSDMSKKIRQAQLEIEEEIKEHGDMAMCGMEIDDCPCGCGSVKIEVEFIALKFTPHGIGVKEGIIERIITM